MNILRIKNHEVSHAIITRYPDGQQNVTLDLEYYDSDTPIQIEASIKNWLDLELLLCTVRILRSNHREIHSLTFMYLFGQRSDRAFTVGQCNYFKDVLLPVIGSMGLLKDEIFFYFPHNHGLVQLQGYKYLRDLPRELTMHNFLGSLIGGDASVGTKYYFDKVRNSYGDIISYTLSPHMIAAIREYSQWDTITVCDDLCDGGKTFELAGEILKEEFPDKKLNLFVAHGIFSKGFNELLKYYDLIFTTNSYTDGSNNTNPRVKIFEVF